MHIKKMSIELLSTIKGTIFALILLEHLASVRLRHPFRFIFSLKLSIDLS